MSQFDLDTVLQFEPVVIVTARGRDFKLWREWDGSIACRTDHETKRFTTHDLDEIIADLELYTPGSWTPCQK